MSKGMWTKHISSDGKYFYYNAVQCRSMWQPPADAASIVHEAQNIQPLPQESSCTFETNPTLELQVSDELQIKILHSKEGASSSVMLPVDSANKAQSEIQEKAAINEMQSNQQKEIAVVKNNRFRKNNDCSTTAGEESVESEYLKQKSALEKMAGSNGEDASKWLVR